MTTEFYTNYIDIDIDTVKELVLAANYLDIAPLLTLGCTKIAIAIKGKSIDEMREIFGIENDLTPEE